MSIKGIKWGKPKYINIRARLFKQHFICNALSLEPKLFAETSPPPLTL